MRFSSPLELVNLSTRGIKGVEMFVRVYILNYIDYKHDSFARAHQLPLHIPFLKRQLIYTATKRNNIQWDKAKPKMKAITHPPQAAAPVLPSAQTYSSA